MSGTRTAVIISAAMAMGAAAVPARGQFYDGTGPQSGSQANFDGFAVMGKGATAAKPNRLEIELEVSASSELTADAIVKYRDARKKLQDAFSALKLSNVAVEERGLLVDQKGQAFNPYYMDSPPARRGKVEVQLKRKLVVAVSNIRAMDEEALLQLVAKLLDVAQDAGGKVGGGFDAASYYYYGYSQQGGKLVRFVLDDYEALQEKAYGEAILDARARAARLAKLSGVELGRVAGVRELLVPGEKSSGTGMPIYARFGTEGDEEVPRKRLESSRFQEIPIRVELLVRFELAGPPKGDKRGAD